MSETALYRLIFMVHCNNRVESEYINSELGVRGS